MAQATHNLEVRRRLKAKPERVYQAWTEAETLTRWFAPNEQVTTVVTALDLRVGGRYRIEMHLPDGSVPTVTGTYEELSPPHRLAFTWRWEASADMPDTLVTIDLIADGDETELVLRHTRFDTEESRDRHQQGWDGCCNRLPNVLR
jgi:uncharacterized protein YndB with AHSA1/START domain